MNIQAQVLQHEVRDLRNLLKVCSQNDRGFVEVLQKHRARLDRVEGAMDALYPAMQAHDALAKAGFLARVKWLLFGILPPVVAAKPERLATDANDFQVHEITPTQAREVMH